ncbi:MAG: DNA polymerase III subunit gamma/tau [Bacteroidales bacterium]|nr:DNA polymerase III subunit gamma/tau [Bacteroidales bacterium]
MSNYIVSARKYRPVTFDSVVGQSSLTTTLKNSIQSGRLAHAYLFCGPRGVGKTTCARIFAKTINCLNPKPNGDACEECESCRAFNEQRSYNIHELDAASNNSVEDIRQLIEQVNIPPQVGRYKVFIVDEVHMLSTAAFNAFLKTLEEPPAHAIFILATTEKHKLLPTILSRCQIYDFNRMTVQDIVGHLENVARQEGITYEPTALNVIAQKADGGMRDALSIFDQVASFCQGNITYQQTIADLNVLDYDYYFKLVDYFLGNNIPDIMLTFDEILSKGFEGSHFVGGLNNHLRNLLVSRDAATVKLLETSDEVRQRYAEQAQRCQPRFLYAAIRKCTDCDLNYRMSQNKRLLVELTLIEIAQLATGDADALPSGLGPTENSLTHSGDKQLKPVFHPAANAAQTAPSAKTEHSQPVSTPAATPAPKAKPQPVEIKPTTSGQSFSIHKTTTPTTQKKQQPQQPSPASTHAEKEGTSAPLTQENLTITWREMAHNLFADDAAMLNRLEQHIPQLQPDDNTLLITADNPMVAELIQRHTPQLQQQLQTTFIQPSLHINVTVRTQEERPRHLTQHQQFNKMCKENEALGKLQQEFQLEIE